MTVNNHSAQTPAENTATGQLTRSQLRANGYLAVPYWVAQRRDITSTEKLILSLFIDALGPENTKSWPGPTSVGEGLGLTTDTAKKGAHSLKAKGFLVPDQISDLGTREYSVAVPDETYGDQSGNPLPGNLVTGGMYSPLPGNTFPSGGEPSTHKALNVSNGGKQGRAAVDAAARDQGQIPTQRI